MRYLVRVIVCADTAEEAMDQAQYVVDDLVEWHEFTSYQVTSESSVWKDCWKPYRLSSKTGQRMVQTAMNEYRNSFLDAMKSIRHMVESYTDEQIFNEEFVQDAGRYLSKFEFSKVSGYHGNVCQLYGPDTDHITTQRELDRYIEDLSNIKLWVVQIDCNN